MIDIIYEDADIIVCVKPAGILSQQDLKGNPNMVDILNNHIRENNHKGMVSVIHRLDKNVGGIMVFAKNTKSAAALSKGIQEHRFLKQYMAVIHGKPEDEEGVLEDLLFKDSSKNRSYIVSRMRKGVKEASLKYRVIADCTNDSDKISLLQIRLHTGRTHQIRVQFSSRKMPLLGDRKYGSRDKCDIALWSEKIGFNHPVTGDYMEYRVTPHDVYPWNIFREQIMTMD